PPLALVGFVLGVVALAKGLPDRGLAIASVALAPAGVFTCLTAAVMLPALGQMRIERHGNASAGQLHSIGQAMMVYATDHDGWYPEAGANWERLLVERGLTPRLLVAPDAPSNRPSYLYIPGRRLEFDSETVILYEDPEIWRGLG